MNNLKKIRLEKNLMLSEVAHFLNISIIELDSLEKGKKNLTINTIDKLCDLFEVSESYLLGKTNSCEKNNSFNNRNLTLEQTSQLNKIINNIREMKNIENEQ